MLNLRCSHCGLLNPITSEYQTFCQHCNKKLSNNFADWHKLHPDKAFEDFKQLFGEAEEAPAAKKKRTRQSRFVTKDSNGKKKILWASLVGFVLMICAIIYWGNKVAHFAEGLLFRQTTPEFYLDETWQTDSLGQYGLILSTPLIFKEADMGYPQQVMNLTEYIKSFKTADSKPMQAMASVIKYKDQVKLNIQAAADGAVNEIKRQQGVSDFRYEEVAKTVSTFPAILQTGSYTSPEKIELNFYDLIILHDHNMWQVMILYKEDDETGEKVAKRMIESVQINP